MAELKTKLTGKSVENFIKKVGDRDKQQDCWTIIELMSEATKAPPRMWGSAVVGFGQIHLKYESGRELDWFPVGFSPRKQALTLYLSCGLEQNAALLPKLGKYQRGIGCLYIRNLKEIDLPTLRKIVRQSVKMAKADPRGMA